MAMTAVERKRLQVERDRAHAKKQTDLVYGLPRTTFGEWLETNDLAGNALHLEICYDGMNRVPPDFAEESDPVSASGSFVFPTKKDGEPSYRGALGRAEMEVELLIEAAKTLAHMLNSYKKAVIRDRITQIETNELTDPDLRNARLKELIDLHKASERLDRSVRADLPQWQLRG